MIINEKIESVIHKSVLCWLATASLDLKPNVSPKETFAYFGNDEIIIANIASPRSAKNIRENPNVCISFIDIFDQRGYKLNGTAVVSLSNLEENVAKKKVLSNKVDGKFKFNTIISIHVESAARIVAPSFVFFPEVDAIEKKSQTIKHYLDLSK